jgi:hypothetical protein
VAVAFGHDRCPKRSAIDRALYRDSRPRPENFFDFEGDGQGCPSSSRATGFNFVLNFFLTTLAASDIVIASYQSLF